MIGALRFVLAGLVVLNHLWLPTANIVGAHAVIAFYVISGFLMTKVIQEVYGAGVRNSARFLINRGLRIYPPYWFFLAISLLLLQINPNFSSYSTIGIPRDFPDWFSNLSLAYLTWSPTIVIPPAWSLSVEMFFYIAMALGLSWSKKGVVAWFLASVLITIALLYSGANFSQRYYPVHAASLFFSLGAMIYFFRDAFAHLTMPRNLAIALVPVYCAFPLMVQWAGFDRTMLGYYGAVALFVPLLVTFLDMDEPRWREWDQKLGDLAYPLFITHFLAAGLVNVMLSGRVVPFGFAYLAWSFWISVLISWLFIRACKLWLDPLRDRVRESAPRHSHI